MSRMQRRTAFSKVGTGCAIGETDQRAAPAPIFEIVNRALANTKVGSGEVEGINARPLGCQGGSTRWNERHCIMYRR